MNHLLTTGDRCITQLAKMSIDLKFVELTADLVRFLFQDAVCLPLKRYDIYGIYMEIGVGVP